MILDDFWFYPLELACITSAVEVDLFTQLQRKSGTVTQLAQDLSLNGIALEQLLFCLVQLELVKGTSGLFHITEESKRFLSRDSEYDKGAYFVQTRKPPVHERLVEYLKSGFSPLVEEGKSFSEMWEKGEIDEKAANGFTRNMHAIMKYPSYLNSQNSEFKSLRYLVDLGGGSGAWATSLTENHPNIEVAIFDLPPVLKAAQKLIESQYSPLKGRIHFKPGNFFKDSLPIQADSYLLSNILHDWPPHQCKALLDQISQHAKSAQPLFIHECLLDEGKMGPKFSVLFNLLMGMNHHAQQFTHTELNALLENSGFTPARILSTQRNYSLLVCQKK